MLPRRGDTAVDLRSGIRLVTAIDSPQTICEGLARRPGRRCTYCHPARVTDALQIRSRRCGDQSTSRLFPATPRTGSPAATTYRGEANVAGNRGIRRRGPAPREAGDEVGGQRGRWCGGATFPCRTRCRPPVRHWAPVGGLGLPAERAHGGVTRHRFGAAHVPSRQQSQAGVAPARRRWLWVRRPHVREPHR